jgi:hypothetical protein
MGLLRVTFYIFVSVIVSNFIIKNLNKFDSIPFFHKIEPYMTRCNLIVTVMSLLMLLF